MIRKILFYETQDGKCPVKDFLDSLTEKVFQKIIWVLRLITEIERIPSTYLKKLKGSDDIWECRIQYGSNIYRLFCFFDDGSLIVLTHGIQKKTQKVPIAEIRKAEDYKKDYIRRSK